MRHFGICWLMAVIVGGVLLTVGAPTAAGQACTCNLANADLFPCTGPDGTVGLLDFQYVRQCVVDKADVCGRPLSVCDVTCDGVVDYRDYSVAFEAFVTGVSSGPCVGVYGACCSINQTSCTLASSEACTTANTADIPGDGVYAGDGTACDPSPCDCNGNGVEDSLDLIDGTSFDCNGNDLPDECDIANGFAVDAIPLNGVPDECDQFNRYLFFTMNDLVPNPTELYAIRVTLLDVNGFESFNDAVRWAGAPFDTQDEDSGDPLRTFKAAQLECTSHYADWGTSELVYIDGGEIVPGSMYAIQAIGESCDEAQEGCYTPAAQWVIITGAWGDVIAPFTGTGSPQPNFKDISSIVAKFIAKPGALPKPRFQLVPNAVFPDRTVDFKDIAAGVAAFVGTPYAGVVGAEAGPCTCPSTVTCGAIACQSDIDCGGGYCVNHACTDPCRRCSP